MMKKNGFTLAEVLITLAIIGVVATMTLPALMNNTQEQQAITGLKKGVNTLTEAVGLNAAIENVNYADITGYGDVKTDSEDETNASTLFKILADRTSIDYAKTNDQDKYHDPDDTYVAFAGGQTVHLRDGSSIIFGPAGDINNEEYNVRGEDGISKGFVVVYDTNGAKGPNALSNCQGKNGGAFDTGMSEEAYSLGNGAGSADIDETADPSDCSVKANRVIKDQFTLFLRDAHVEPAGAAAVWAFNK